ncbi:antibiotic biosynthesis monooxygenase family protein [Aliikangiella coralliicola]|uniref:ABM domain-containing protein n=1 Tax=Aliikangiella coralliicola TaxID=2592383 RepID=A0A545UEM6_9GAMM|nr:antibiotic biosynthesis monooxygenase [Aliikangiella coralliicola]TQV87922.1 hypothetical protein FLL46_11125 [Aliikangiella coralliicola]
MITRVFRIQVHKEYVNEFEHDYKNISVPLVKSQRGLLSVETGKTLSEGIDEYIMISRWQDIDMLKAFVGESWQKALIPSGMEKYVQQCWVEHYETEQA